MNIKLLVGIAALTVSTLSSAQDVTPYDNLPVLQSRDRAEVLAEFALWRRAGLDQYNYDGADFNRIEYERRMAEYARLRNGPDYVAELERLQARTRSAGMSSNSALQ